MSVNAEGDTAIREETLEGLGTPPSFLQILFGAILKIAAPTRKASPQTEYLPTQEQSVRRIEEVSAQQSEVHEQAQDLADATMAQEDNETGSQKKSWLTSIFPDPGYFAAGGLAGVISRTATAPLDRLKVYLIANTGPNAETIDLVKKGDAASAAKTVGRPLVNATRELWKAGGIRSLFAGKYLCKLPLKLHSNIRKATA